MNIINLPDETQQFEEGLKHAITMVQSSCTGASFLSKYVELIKSLRSNSNTKDWIKNLEEEAQKRTRLFNSVALEVCKNEWLFLWKLNPTYKCRRILLQVLRSISRGEYSSQSPITTACGAFTQLKIISPVMKKINNIRTIYEQLEQTFFRWENGRRSQVLAEPSQPHKKIKATLRKNSRMFGVAPKLYVIADTNLLGRKISAFDSEMCSPKFNQFFYDYREQFYPPEIKKEFIQTSTELDPVYLWDRLCLLEKIWEYKRPLIERKVLPQRFERDSATVWEKSIEGFIWWTFPTAKNSLISSFEEKTQQNVFRNLPILPEEFYFSRGDCSRYLNQVYELVVKNQILVKKQSTEFLPQSRIIDKPLSKKEQRTLEVVDHAVKYWNDNPEAKHAEVYHDYRKTRRSGKAYAYETWVKIVRDRELDPRPREKKTRRKQK